MSLTPRQTAILFEVIAEYIATAQPVASGALVRRVDASAATVRNECAALEGEGYLVQPHTSAGRVPTPAAYEMYVEYLQRQEASGLSPSRRSRGQPRDGGGETDARIAAFARLIAEVSADLHLAVRAIARAIAAEAGQAAVVGVVREDAAAAGLSFVIVQPEFQDADVRRAFSEGIDALDDSLAAIDAQLNEDEMVILGDANPFGAQAGTVAGHLALPEGHRLTIGITGPMRMAYDRQLGLLRDVRAAVGRS